MTIVSPSLLSADFARLGEEIATIPNADWLHVDVMDDEMTCHRTTSFDWLAHLIKREFF